MSLKIYVDGSASSNGKFHFGIGIVFVYNGKILKSFSYKVPFIGASFVAEQVAIIYALCMIDFSVDNLTIYTDQMLTINTYNGNAPKNNTSKELIKIINELVDNLDCRQFRLRYCKSHSGNAFHNLADNLARKALNSNIEFGLVI